MSFEGWTPDELQARLDELQPAVDEVADLEEAVEYLSMLAYLRDEGFIDIEYDAEGDIRCYPKEDPCYLDELLPKQ